MRIGFISKGWGVTVMLVMCVSVSSHAISRFNQPTVESALREINAAILEENDSFYTVMTETSVRCLSKQKVEVLARDPNGDREFIQKHRNQNGDYWYWAHQKAREVLILALGRQPEEAVKCLDTIPFTEGLIPEYEWITSPEFRAWLLTANDDLAYLMEPYIGVNVFFTNYQISKLEREYPIQRTRGGGGPQIPILELNIRDLVSTPRTGQKDTVGLDATLSLPGGGIYDSLLPTSKEYAERKIPFQNKLITAGDFRLKIIPVSCQETKAMFEVLMGRELRFLEIVGSTNVSSKGVRLSDDLKVVVNKESPIAQYLMLQRDVFKDAKIKRAQ